MQTESNGTGNDAPHRTVYAKRPPAAWTSQARDAWDHLWCQVKDTKANARGAFARGDDEDGKRWQKARERLLVKLDRMCKMYGGPPEETDFSPVVSWADMQGLPPLAYLVDDMLVSGGTSLVVGHPKSGKSTLARVLAAEVAGHGDGQFLGRDVTEPGRVLYHGPDEAPQMTVQHFRGILPVDATEVDFVPGPADLDLLARAIEDGDHKLLIVDTLGRLFAGERFPDGDAYMVWQSSMDAVRQVANRTGCHVCLLHHARKSGGARSLAVLGSAALAGAVDTVLSVTVDDVDGDYIRHVETTNRAGVELPRQRLTLAGDGWLTVEPPAKAKPDPSDEARAEARAMRADGNSLQQIADAKGISKSTAKRWTR